MSETTDVPKDLDIKIWILMGTSVGSKTGYPKLWIFIEKYNCYLVYMPAKRELESGLLDQPAMCTTVHSLHTGKLPSVYVMFGKISEISL